MKTKQILKENAGELSLLAVSLFLPFLLTNRLLFALLTMLFTLLFSGLLFYFSFRERRKRDKELSALFFLSAFFRSLRSGFSGENSYSAAGKYLPEEEKPYAYEDALESEECGLPLGKYAPFFALAMKSEKEGESHLLNTSLLLRSLEADIALADRERKKARRARLRNLAISLFFFFLMGVISNYTAKISESLFTRTNAILLTVLYPLSFFLLSLEDLCRYKGGNSHVR